MKPCWSSLAALLVLVLAGSEARADEPDAPRRTLPPPAATLRASVDVACTTEGELRARLEELGVLARDREIDTAALVDVTLRPGGHRDASDATRGELVVTSPRGVVLARAFEDRCDAVVDALVLAAAHALERERELGWEVARSSEPPEPDPAPVPVLDPPERDEGVRVPGPRGEGGVAAFGLVSGAVGSATTTARGVHALATRRIGKTRVGVAGSIADVEGTFSDPGQDVASSEFTGRATRVGATLGWGAPWNDGVVGFLVEGGVAWGALRGAVRRGVGRVQDGEGGTFCFTGGGSAGGCFRDSSTEPHAKTWASPYLAWSLVLSVPIRRLPVRPVALVSWSVTPGGPSTVGMSGELGIVWQAF